MPVLILNETDVQRVVDKLPPTEERNRIRGSLHAALVQALPAITEALDYYRGVELLLTPLRETVQGSAELLGDDLFDEIIGDVETMLYNLRWATAVDEDAENRRKGLEALTAWLGVMSAEASDAGVR